MKSYRRVMLGRQNVFAAECFAGGFIGADFGITEDLASKLPGEWREFNAEYIPKFLAARPEKTKIAAGLACGSLWTIARGINRGDIPVAGQVVKQLARHGVDCHSWQGREK